MPHPLSLLATLSPLRSKCIRAYIVLGAVVPRRHGHGDGGGGVVGVLAAWWRITARVLECVDCVPDGRICPQQVLVFACVRWNVRGALPAFSRVGDNLKGIVTCGFQLLSACLPATL